MDVAIVAPCPIPYQVGGAENLWRALQDHINEQTPHRAEILKLPTREFSFWELVDSYRHFAELDLTGFDVVLTSKYPAWMVAHERHVCYMLHPLRGLYDTYRFFRLPDRHPTDAAPVLELRALMQANAGRREALGGFFDALDGLRDARGLPDDLFAFPGPFIREIVHFLDGIALAPDRIVSYGAISRTVAERDGYFPDGGDVFVAYPPTGLQGLHGGRGKYLFTAGRLDEVKRVDLLIEALKHVKSNVELRIAGSGPEEQRLRALAGDDRRIVFCGRVPAEELVELYARARAVAYLPFEEDFGYVALEGMLSGKPVITCSDSGGTTELVGDGETGLVCDPTPEAIGAAIDRLWSDRGSCRRMGVAGLESARNVNWDPVIARLEAAGAT
ncbi:glycosyltransferase family 4 protein [Solirubrobacter taibaiensis]|nr:glycosyltransferase family 4 protein [Solirubrobacter taibaiensis]